MKIQFKFSMVIVLFCLASITTQVYADCDTAWAKYSEDNTKDEYLKYRTKSISKLNGRDYVSESTSLQTVLASDRDAVHWQYTMTVNGMVTATKADITRAQYTASCKSNPEIDHGDETITVSAGTFLTTWRKFKFEQNGIVTVSTSWIATLASGEQIPVKTITDAIFASGSAQTDSELLETNKK